MNIEHSSARHGGSNHPLSRRDFISVAALGAGAMPVLLSAKESAPDMRPHDSAVRSSYEKATTYATLNRESWASILADSQPQYATPLTVHLPIQPVFQRDFIHVDCALNVCRRRVIPKLSTSEPAPWEAARAMEAFVVQFAVDDPPQVPDFHSSQLSLAEGKFPLAHARYFLSDFLYELDYFCCPWDERQSLLWIGVSVTNDADTARRAHVRAKVNFQIESRIFDPHYVPFYWDATKWLPYNKVQLKDNAICRDSAPIGRTIPGDWTLEWEAMFMLLPMLRLGHFEPVRRSLDFIFSLQDAGHPPEGELTTTAGAIGTTGPKWLNTTGSALALATDYYRYSRDEEFLKAYLPKMLKAMNWIVGELRATRKLNPDGSRPLYYGLMPFGCATDGDIGRIVAFTDAFTFWGLDKAVALLEQMQHERADEFRRELEIYRTDLARAIEGMTRPDGYIERKILTGKEPRIEAGFERICSAINLAFTGAIEVHSDRFRRFVAHFEEKLMDGFFTGRMTRDIAYMGVGEFAWHHAYLRLGEWKKAFVAMRTNLRYGMTQDTFQVQERFSRTHPNFTPWQPNGSGNGRMLEMMLNCLYFEHDDRVTLLGGVPFLWLANNGVTALQNLRTPRGSVSLEARMLDRQHCCVTVRASARGVLPRLVQVPDPFVLSDLSPGVVRKDRGLLELPAGAQEISFILQQNPEA